MREWLVIAGDFTPLGGMDRANHALAMHLASGADTRVHLVAHRVWRDLVQQPAIAVTRVRRPFGSHALGAPFLASAGERRAKQVHGAHVVANGGNADAGDVTWVHYLHAAHVPQVRGVRRKMQTAALHAYYQHRERAALRHARLVLCNSERTAKDAQEYLGVEPARTRVVYYGTDVTQFALVSDDERASARRTLGWAPERPVALFVGALGDRRKGFDRLLAAWNLLCRDPSWDAILAVTGHGAELAKWRRRAAELRIDRCVKFLGFRSDIAMVIAASDVMVHPARYEAYGLGVHEAICRGLPAIVSARAGIAELYPPTLADLLIADVEDEREIAERLHRWRWDIGSAAARILPLSNRLRARQWRDMGAEIERAVTA
jgi:glycosyltransferase involved in cell wall biosynthesis